MAAAAVTEPATLSLADARVLDRYWRAANYLAGPDAHVPSLVVAAREDIEIARQARDVLARPGE